MGGFENSQSSWGLANLCWYRNAGSRASKLVLAQHFVLGGLPDLKADFGGLLKKLLFRTDGAFAAMDAWDARLGEQPEQPGASKPVVV